MDNVDYSVEYLDLHKPVNSMVPTLSVRIITYNHKNYIGECIDSALMQKVDFPFEIVIGEDDSTDGSRKICQNYAEKYPDRIRLILRSERNKIILDGRKTGRYNFIETIKSCRGTYIALLDGDDYWTDILKLQKQVDFLNRHSDYVMTMHDSSIADAKGRVLRKSILGINYKTDISALELQKGFGLITSTMCFRNVIKDFPNEFYKVMIGDDFLTSMLGKYGKGKHMKEIEPSVYRIHGSSMFSSLNASQALDFSINTNLQLFSYYTRINEPELARHFKEEQITLSNKNSNWIKRRLLIIKNKIYLFQLYFLKDKLRLFLRYFKK